MTAPDVDGVIFDLGGVLIDVDFHRALQYWRAMGATVPAAPPSSDPAYERFERGETTFEHYAQHLRGHHGVVLGDQELLSGWNRALGDPLPGAMALLESAAGRWPLFLFSNTNAAHHACWSQRASQLLAPFEALFTSHELGLRKPDPEAFQRVVRQIGIDAGRLLFLDDLSENVSGALSAGLRSLQVDGPAEAARALGLSLPPESPDQ